MTMLYFILWAVFWFGMGWLANEAFVTWERKKLDAFKPLNKRRTL